LHPDEYDLMRRRNTIPAIEFSCGEGYFGEGVSHGLARGILVLADGRNVTGEGMGIGAVALKDPHYTFFSRNCKTTVVGLGVIEKTFLIDSRLLWGRVDKPSVFLTRVHDRIIDWYMRWPAFQALLPFGSSMRSIFGLKSFFEPIPPVTEVRFIYQISKNKIEVSCSFRPPTERFASLFILNELAADIFTHGFSGGNITHPPSGWMEFEPGSDLYDPKRHLRFCFSYHAREKSVPVKVWWGREYTRDLRWSGFEIEFQGIKVDQQVSCSYEVSFITETQAGSDQGA
jgi:hypothetical protein